jgi:hypothetical protein
MRKLLTSSPLVVLSVPISVYKQKPVICNCARGSMHYALAAAPKAIRVLSNDDEHKRIYWYCCTWSHDGGR